MGIIHSIVLLLDFGIIKIMNLSPELFPMLILLDFLVFGIIVVRERNYHKNMISKSNDEIEEFE